MLESLCRRYQSLFHASHPEEAKLVELHQSGRNDEFLKEYFEHEYRKGAQVLEKFRALAPQWKGGRCLDFGCGGGGLSYRLAEHCDSVVGLDLEEDKIAFAKAQADRLNRHNCEFICYPGGDIPLPESSVDSIVCIDVVEHLPTPDRFFAEFRRVLKPGGQLLLSFGPPWRHAHGKHMWAKLPGWWTHLLFPRRVVMKVAGYPHNPTWEELGIMRLTVGRFHRILKASGFETLVLQEHIKSALKPLKLVPLVRELFISEVVGVFRRP
jgi:ubiquinone/menaquinone biosynthesis C-methylase UbiE